MIIALLAAGGAWYYYSRYLPAQAAPPTETIRTAQVTQGDLVIAASGTGDLVPATEASVGFLSGGVLTELSVKVGDQVAAGQVLARVDDADARAQVSQAQISLRQAELQLAKLTADPSASEVASARSSLLSAQAGLRSLTAPPTAEELASAQASLASAQADLDNVNAPASARELEAAGDELVSAQAALTELLAGPSEQELIILKADLEKAGIDLQQAQAEYDRFAWRQGYETSPQSAALQQATISYQTVKANYELGVAGPTGQELASARAKVAQAQAALEELEEGVDAGDLLAAEAKLLQAQAALDELAEDPDPEDLAVEEAKVAQAQAALDELLAGASAEDLEAAELDVEQARNSLASAQEELEGTVLRAPFAGIISAVEATVGESVGTTAFIILADLEHPLVRFWVEETDLASVTVGNRANIVFEALPDDTFAGEVIRVEPSLVEVNGTLAVQSWASVDLSTKPRLLSGMTVDEVEVVAAEARDTLLVPVQALRELQKGQYAVFVVNAEGELRLRLVEVGLKDLVNAEILSGLELGEEVSMGTTVSSQDASSTRGEVGPPEGGMPPGGMIFRMAR
jgi:multidrug efflux pump subunit AcrA (membrane-fusion protein)